MPLSAVPVRTARARSLAAAVADAISKGAAQTKHDDLGTTPPESEDSAALASMEHPEVRVHQSSGSELTAQCLCSHPKVCPAAA